MLWCGRLAECWFDDADELHAKLRQASANDFLLEYHAHKQCYTPHAESPKHTWNNAFIIPSINRRPGAKRRRGARRLLLWAVLKGGRTTWTWTPGRVCKVLGGIVVVSAVKKVRFQQFPLLAVSPHAVVSLEP